MPPWSVYERGRDILQAVLDGLDESTRKELERDWEILKANPLDPSLDWEWWKGIDHIPEPSRVAILAGRFACRYVVYEGGPEPAIVACVDRRRPEGLDQSEP